MSKRVRTKRQIMVNKKAMHKQQNIEQHEPPINTGESPGAPEEKTVPAPLVAAVMFVGRRGHALPMLFVFIIYLYWCPIRFPCQMMGASFNGNMTAATSGAGTVFSSEDD
jgi:hypothetical protein